MAKIKALLLDIETAPVLAHVWALFDQNVAINQINRDWHVISWAAKWLGEKTIMYADQRGKTNVEDDKKLLAPIWQLIDEADVLITQNGKRFDLKKLNARFLLNGYKPPSPVRHIDTLVIAKKHFAFTSNKLEYLSDKINLKHKKSTHGKFHGFELWKQCLAGNFDAWRELERYNKADILALEELYTHLYPWDNSIDFNAYSDETDVRLCHCGSKEFKKKGFQFSNNAKYQRYKCLSCGAHHTSRINLLSKEKRNALKSGE